MKIVLLVAILICSTDTCRSMAAVDMLPEGKIEEDFAVHHGWPDGVPDLVNDPSRAKGWNFWFSECSNDVYNFVFDVSGTPEINRLILSFSKIDAKPLRLYLSYRNGAGAATAGNAPPETLYPVEFSIGSQPMIDRWYGDLPEVEPGVRKFGVHLYRETPKATPPTLTIYTGDGRANFEDLNVPLNVEVEMQPDALSRRIDRFIADHRAKQAKLGEMEPKEDNVTSE